MARATPSAFERLVALRQISGWSQVDLAILAGLSRWRLNRIERGKSEARASELEKLAAALGVTIQEFYGERAA